MIGFLHEENNSEPLELLIFKYNFQTVGKLFLRCDALIMAIRGQLRKRNFVYIRCSTMYGKNS